MPPAPPLPRPVTTLPSDASGIAVAAPHNAGHARRTPTEATAEARRENLSTSCLRPLKLPALVRSREPASTVVPLGVSSGPATLTCRRESPWLFYEPFFTVSQGEGTATIALSRSHGVRGLVAIKRRAGLFTRGEESQLMRISHENIVELRETFLYEGHLYSVYDRMDVSLADIGVSPVPVGERHVSAISKQ
ncbi:hypothetical protein LTS18_005951, partial [Coniosporium uncinatum]